MGELLGGSEGEQVDVGLKAEQTPAFVREFQGRVLLTVLDPMDGRLADLQCAGAFRIPIQTVVPAKLDEEVSIEGLVGAVCSHTN
jgi:hypothetical protein